MRMVDIERHRGPDAAGSLVQGPAAIGMRRLSIIDLAGGDQPIFNEDRSMAIVFNGEIFNYVELKEELAGKGHVFRTNSDTEVLVHLYEECGTAMLARLNGMFAFAIWDRRRQSIFLARDRMGVKPLYYTAAGRRWLFASELKCLLTQPETNTRLDLDAVADFLRLGYIPRDATPYQAVRKLLPGHSLFIDDSGGRVERWWDLAEGFNPEPATEAELRRELEEIFDDAVRIRMRSDVPVASFLSGGLDSSLVTVTAQRQSDIPLRTFTMAFENTEFDETGYAQAVASHAGTVHSVNTASPRTAMSHLPLLLWHMDEPMGDSSIIPNYLITHFAAQQVKVCLSGLGGDELFGGYARYNDPCRGRIRRLFSIAPKAAGVLAPVLDPFMFSWAEELRVASGSSNDWRTYLHRLQTFDTAGLRALGFPARGRAENTVEDLWKRYPGTDSISRRQFVDQHTYLPDQILALTDRMSMANSLEVRVPFMDYRLVRFSQRLTSAVKQTPSDFKIFLKRVLGDRCPPEILSRPKWGFDTPLKKWVTRPELFQFIQRLPEGVAVREGLFRADTVRAMVATPDMVTNAARKVWNLAVLEVWLRTARRPEPPRESLPELLEATECAAR